MDAQPSLAPECPAHCLVSTCTDGEELSPITTLAPRGLPPVAVQGLLLPAWEPGPPVPPP